MELDQIIVYSGSIYALVFAGVLWFIPSNLIANRYLSFLIVALGGNLLLSTLLQSGYYNLYPLLHLLPFGVAFTLGPLIYLYTDSLCSDRPPRPWPLLWLLMDYPHSVYHLIFGRDIEHSMVHEVLDKLGALSIFVTAFYLWKSRKLIWDYQAQLQDKLSNLERQTLNWLKQLIVLFLISIPLASLFYILLMSVGLDLTDRLIVNVYMLIAIFWLGIGGVRQPQISFRKRQETDQQKNTKNVHAAHLDLLIKAMENDKLYLLPDLNVRFLEERLSLSSKQISEALNQGLNKNFYYFINEYRVEEFKLQSKENPHLTLVGIAMECGFNSKTTFQRVFKQITGMKPSEYLDR